MPTILTKKSDTPGSVPATADLTNAAGGAELAVNTADKRLFALNSSSAVVEIGTNPGSLTTADASATVFRSGSATITNLIATTASVSDLSATVSRSASATITNLLATSLTVSSGSTLNGGVVINELGADADTRIEGDTDANLFFVDASTDRIGIGTNAPATKFEISANNDGVTANNTLRFTDTDTSTAANQQIGKIEFFSSDSSSPGASVKAYIGAFAEDTTPDAYLAFATDSSTGTATERMRIDSSGNLGLGVTPSAWESNWKALQLFGGGSLSGISGLNLLRIASNAYFLNDQSGKYIASDFATHYQQYNGEHRFYTAPSGTAGNNITFTQAMTLSAAGDLAVGQTTSVPYSGNPGSTNFTLSGTSNPTTARPSITLKNSDDSTRAWWVIDANSGAFIGTYTNNFFGFQTNNTERARITAGGEFLAGATTANASSVHIFQSASTTKFSGGTINTSAAPLGHYIQYPNAAPNSTGAEFLYCVDSAALRASIRSNGGLANYSANNVNLASDERLKKDISPLATAWSKVKEMEVVNFRYKDCNEGDPLLYGVIAQQVQPIVPELVVVTQEAKEAVAAKDAVMDEEGNVVEPAVEAKEATPEYYGIREQPMYWLAIKALQEAMTRIEELEARLAQLEAK